MALDQNYYKLWFESFYLNNKSGHRSEVQLKLIPAQDLPSEITNECYSRSVDPYNLLTECNKKLFTDYSIGTKFLLKAKLTDRDGEGLFFYNYYGWRPFEIVCPK